MTYQTTITRKGQLTFPKALRELLGLGLGSRVILKPETGGRVKITPIPSLRSLAGSFHVAKPSNPVAIRKQMERNYKRA